MLFKSFRISQFNHCSNCWMSHGRGLNNKINNIHERAFNHCSIVWMSHGGGLNNKINNIHERALRIVYKNKKSSFETLIKRDKSAAIHLKNLQYLATKLFKIKIGLSLEIMKSFARK